LLSGALTELGQFDEAHPEAAVQIAEAADHPSSLSLGLLQLGLAHSRREDNGARRFALAHGSGLLVDPLD